MVLRGFLIWIDLIVCGSGAKHHSAPKKGKKRSQSDAGMPNATSGPQTGAQAVT
jgi:hypothetical protein